MLDQFGRTIDYMRVSITDRCNLRCRYCMPDGISLVSMKEIMTYEEIVETCAAAVRLGIRNIKITGGEPLARLGCAGLIASLKKVTGVEQVTMTTNGVLLKKYLPELLAAGLDAVNISLDTLDPAKFERITGRNMLSEVLDSIDAALDSGLRTKINVVLQQDVNDDEWFPLASLLPSPKSRLTLPSMETVPPNMSAFPDGWAVSVSSAPSTESSAAAAAACALHPGAA